MAFAVHDTRCGAKPDVVGLYPYGAEPTRLYVAALEPRREVSSPLARLDYYFDLDATLVSTMLRRILARVSRVLDLARLLDLPDNHPDRMIAASIVLYVARASSSMLEVATSRHRIGARNSRT